MSSGATRFRCWNESRCSGCKRSRASGRLRNVYLLGLAVRHGGRLATSIGRFRSKAVVGASTAHLDLIGSLPTAP